MFKKNNYEINVQVFMKTLILSLIAFTGAAYGGHWYYKAEEAKQVVATQLEQLQKDPNYTISYGPLSVGGFPESYEVTIPNLKIEPKNPNSNNQTNFKSVSLDGTIVLGTDLWGTAYWIHKKGTSHLIVSPSNNEFVSHIDSQISANVFNPDKTKAFNHPFSTVHDSFFDLTKGATQIRWDNVKKGDINVKDFSLKGVEGSQQNQELMKFDHLDLSWTNDKGEKDWNVSLNLNLKGFESAPNLDKSIKEIAEGSAHLPVSMTTLPSLPAGKTNVIFEGDALLPPHLSQENFSYDKIKLNVKKLDVTSSWGSYHLDSAFHLDTDKEENKKIHFDWNSKSNTTEEEYNNIVKDFIAMAKNPPEKTEEPDFVAEKLYQLSQCCEKDLVKIIPHYPTLSPIESKILFDMNINKQNRYNVEIKNFDITAKPYGMLSKGQTVLEENNEPKGIYKIELQKYKDLINDGVNYYNNLIPVINAFSEGSNFQASPASEQNKKDILTFLKSVSDDPEKDAENLNVTINFLDIQNMTIGTLTPTDVQVEWEKLMQKIGQPTATPQPATANR